MGLSASVNVGLVQHESIHMVMLQLLLNLIISADSDFLAWAYQKNADSGPGGDIDQDQGGNDCDGWEWQLP